MASGWLTQSLSSVLNPLHHHHHHQRPRTCKFPLGVIPPATLCVDDELNMEISAIISVRYEIISKEEDDNIKCLADEWILMEAVQNTRRR